MTEPAWKSWTCWTGAFLFLIICFVFVWLLDGCIEPKQEPVQALPDPKTTLAMIEQYDSIMLAKLDSMNRVSRMESIQAQMLMIIWNANPGYRNILRPYVKVYADSFLRQRLTVKDTFDFRKGMQ